jgi:hypothetical protein
MNQTSARREGISHTTDSSAIRLFSLSHWGRAAVPEAALPLTLGIDGDDHWLPAASFNIGQKHSTQNPRTGLILPPANKPSTLVSPSDPEQLDDEQGERSVEEWRQSLLILQEWICELLIQNQKLRMSLLDSATIHGAMEADQ